MVIAATIMKEIDKIAIDVAERFEIKIIGEVKMLLGLEMKRDRKTD